MVDNRAEPLIIEESLEAGETVSSAARRHGVARNLLYRWRRLLTEAGTAAVDSDEPVVGNSEVKKPEDRVPELGRMLGRKTMEVELLRDALSKAGQKADIAADLVAEGRWPMKTVADPKSHRGVIAGRHRRHSRVKNRWRYDIPRDFSVTGFDDVPQAVFMQPLLTTIRQPRTLIGRHAMSLLLELLNGDPAPENEILLVPDLVVRNSVAAPSRLLKK